MFTWNAEAVLSLLCECAVIARKGKESLHVQVKKDSTPVTEADQKIEAYITSVLGAGKVLGEETYETAGSCEKLLEDLAVGEMYIVDPIDGTANFVNNRPCWAVSLGYARGGVLTEGAVLLPEEGAFLCSENGETFTAQTCKAYPEKEELFHALRKFSGPLREYDSLGTVNLSQYAAKAGTYRGVNPVFTCGSCVVSGMDLIRGRDLVYITSAKLWDLAGIVPCLRNAGFACCSPSGLDLLSGKITDELFVLRKGTGVPFALREMNLLGVSEKAVRSVLADCVYP